MANTYSLKLAADTEPRTLLELAFPALAGSVSEDLSPTGRVLLRLETAMLSCVARREADPRVREVFEELFDLVPHTSLTFRLAEDSGGEAGHAMADAVVRVLSGVAGDAILLLNGEAPRARRRGAAGVLDQRASFWRPEHLADLGPSWRVGEDPGPTNL